MAKLLAYYSLCPINDIREFLGLSCDVGSGCIINTLGRNIIQVVKLSNQKLQHSWTSLERLTSKVVYDFRSERYVGVFGSRYIRCWTADQIDINKAKRVKFFRNILELLTLDNGQVLVVYDDGTCESLESAVVTRNEDRKHPDSIPCKPNVDPTRASIQQVCTAVTTNGDRLLTYFVKDLECSMMELNFVPLNKENLKPVGEFRKIKLERRERNVQLVGQCIVDGSGGPSLITIWSDKRIFAQFLNLEEDYTAEPQSKSIGNFISILNMINTGQPLSMIGISKDYIAVYASNLNQEGATLLLYNVQFKAVQAKQFFKVYFSNSRFWVCENHILLAFGQTLAVVPFKISKEQLSDMVGTQKSLDLPNYVDNESINEDCDYNEGYSFMGHLVNTVDRIESTDEEQKTEKFKVFESLETFEESLRIVYRSNIQVDIVRDETLPEDVVQMRMMSNVDRSIGPLIFSENFETFVNELEERGFCEMEISDKIIPIMLEANATLDIAKCLKRYSTISERALVATLKYALACKEPQPSKVEIPDIQSLLLKCSDVKLPDSKQKEEFSNQYILDCHDISDQARNDLLNIVLSCSLNRSVMLPLLRSEIELNTVLDLLDHLLFLLIDPVAQLMESPTNSDSFDSDEKVIEWITLLIDSYYQQIVLSRDNIVKEKIVTLKNTVERHIDSLRELKSLAPKIQRLAEGKGRDNERQSNQWYSVETIQLY
ncbi:nucleolar protein 11-like [Topomyia yanbarensis]|uniref:nucleolar protein 11-like n=1 Tax=Topomyia yanbarensis TaxID=2498891 RepID=UPI00273C7128|nr:nucleolar protein 11-like [Topomyia yanbarensis]